MRKVSITLQRAGDGPVIAQAIEADNPGCEVSRMPALVKIDREGEIVIKAATIGEQLGREWDPVELQLSMISLSGNIDEDDEQFVLSWQ